MAAMLLILQIPQVELPRAPWVATFFDVTSEPDRFRGHFARREGWDLRRNILPKGDEEIRLWYAPWLNIQEALLLRKRAKAWSAEKLFWGGGDKYDKDWSIHFKAPKSGWTAFWSRADKLGIRTLPDDSLLPQKYRHLVDDGIALTVEIQARGRYRAYRYDNPQCQTEWPEAAKMAELFEFIEKEFPD